MRLVKFSLVLLWSIGLWLAPLNTTSFADSLVTSSGGQSLYVAGFFDFLNAKTQAAQGKMQEMRGDLTDNPVDQIEGKAKQADAVVKEKVNASVENADTAGAKAQRSLDQLEGKAKGFNLKDQAGQAIDDAGENIKDLQEKAGNILDELTK